jgi:hypothetical protein
MAAATNPTMGRTLLDKGHELQEQYSTIVSQRGANRRSLRDLDTQELLTDDEAAEVLEMYPFRKTAEEDGEFEGGDEE